MSLVLRIAAPLLLALGLTACGGTPPVTTSEGASSSGVTVFGTIDAAVTRSR